MRSVLVLLIVAAAPLIAPASAAEPRWCAVWGDGARNCQYPSMARCQEATAGAGGKCIQDSAADAHPAKAASTPIDELDKVLDRVNKKSDSLILCRGC